MHAAQTAARGWRETLRCNGITGMTAPEIHGSCIAGSLCVQSAPVQRIPSDNSGRCPECSGHPDPRARAHHPQQQGTHNMKDES